MPPRSESPISEASSEAESNHDPDPEQTLVAFTPSQGRFTVPQEKQDTLEKAVKEWRDERHKLLDQDFCSAEFVLPSKELRAIVDGCALFLKTDVLDKRVLRKLAPLALASEEDLASLLKVIGKWRHRAVQDVAQSPSSGNHIRKKARPSDSTPSLPQPAFPTLSAQPGFDHLGT